MDKVKAFFKSWEGGIVIGVAVAVAIEARHPGTLATNVDKIPLLGKFITGHK